jgi:hypothetical protein
MADTEHNSTPLKLYMLLLGSKAPGRHVEQHDFFFGIASSLKDLIPDMKAFWPEAGDKIHIDGWREVNAVDGYKVTVRSRDDIAEDSSVRLFFINLGGYQENKFEEQHYVILTAKPDRASAIIDAKKTAFFKHNQFKGATSHIDDKYGVDVDDVYEIEEVLTSNQKMKYKISLTKDESVVADNLNLGYLKLSNL